MRLTCSFILVVLACGGTNGPNEDGAYGGGMPDAGDSSDAAAGDAVRFETDVWPVFIKSREPPFTFSDGGTPYASCDVVGRSCHGADPPGAGLSMTDA